MKKEGQPTRNPRIALSLLVAYRNRPNDLSRLLKWYQEHQSEASHKIEVVVIEASPKPTVCRQSLSRAGFRYYHLALAGNFHKTAALNFGLAHARGEFVTPYDVDLIPLNGVLTRHIEAARTSRSLLVAGYRLMSLRSNVDPTRKFAPTDVQTAPEDNEISLRNQLIHGERLGMVPFFQKTRLKRIGGWDEDFIGWGCEDSDTIERYLKRDLLLVRSPDLVYLHYPHFLEGEWHEADLISRNRRLYHSRKRQRDQR